MRNLLRALLATGCVVAIPVYAEEVGRAGDSPPEVPENVTEMTRGSEGELATDRSVEPEGFVRVAEYTGFGGEGLPSRE